MANQDLTLIAQPRRRPRVIIVGCGFGGLFAARALARAPVEVLVIDRNNYHLFQPLLYQVASAALGPADIAQPIRTVLRGQANAFVMLGEANAINLAQGAVDVADNHLSYDYLILAPGAVDNYFGHSEWPRWAPGMKEVEDATFIRSRLLLSFETAELEADPTQRAAHLSFVIVGGGPTGVELAGAIKELAVDVIARDFRVADTRRARVILIEAGPRLLPALHPASSRHALAQLKDLGVEVRLGQPVTEIFADGVEVGGERLHSYNVIWAAGVRAHPLVASLGVPVGPGGRVQVMPDCSLPGYPQVFVIGDAAYLVDSKSSRPVPGVSQGALQMGRFVARVIAEDLKGVRTARDRGFHYVDWGSMATIGKSRAVVEIGPLRFGGLLAWLAWMFLHVSVLIGFRNRIAVMTSWIYGYVFSRRGSRLITRSRPSWPMVNFAHPAGRARAAAAIATAAAAEPKTLRGFFEVFRYSRRALELVWRTNPGLTVALGVLTLIAGVVPAGVAYIGSLIVDAVVAAVKHPGGSVRHVFELVLLEGALVASTAAAQRGISLCQSLLRAQLGQRVNVMILEKALTLELQHFEDSEFYDKLTRARREASSRPLSLIMRTFGLAQNGISLVSYGTLLARFSPWAVAVLLLAGLPAFVAEAKFSGDAFRLFRWRSPETRMQTYLETVLAREDHAKEVKLFGLGPRFLQRYRDIFGRLYREDRALTIRRDAWGFGLGLIATLALYGAYAWIALSAARALISLGQMTMYLLLFRQGQAAVSASLSAVGGMYEDNLYLSTLYEYLETPVPLQAGAIQHGPDPKDGVRFENVSFSYPDAAEPALDDVSLHLLPGESLALVGENGSGKTTLIKLLTRLYPPTSGRILLDGLDLHDWDESALRQRIGVIFQDFARYQMLVGENVGAGDDQYFEDEGRWREAAAKGQAAEFIKTLPQGYHTQLGKWFRDGRELSGGQWQKIALARAFMRTRADVLVLDEPTAAMDAQAEADVFEHFRKLALGRITILISHRFSTVRMADQIAVLEHGRIVERGSHEQLMALNGRYAHLFTLQAKAYR